MSTMKKTKAQRESEERAVLMRQFKASAKTGRIEQAEQTAGVLKGLEIASNILCKAYSDQSRHSPGSRPALGYLLDLIVLETARVCDGTVTAKHPTHENGEKFLDSALAEGESLGLRTAWLACYRICAAHNRRNHERSDGAMECVVAIEKLIKEAEAGR